MRKWLVIVGTLLLLAGCSGTKQTGQPPVPSGPPPQGEVGHQQPGNPQQTLPPKEQGTGSAPSQTPDAQPAPAGTTDLAARMESKPASTDPGLHKETWSGEAATHLSVTGNRFVAKLVPKGGAWVLSLTKLARDGRVIWRAEGGIRHSGQDQMGQLQVTFESSEVIYLAPSGEVERFDYKTGRSQGISRLPVAGTAEIGDLFFASYGYEIVNLYRSTGGAQRFNLTKYKNSPPYALISSASDFDVAASPFSDVYLEMRANRVRIYRDGKKPVDAAWPISVDSRLYAYFARQRDEVLIVGRDLTLGRVDGTLIAHLSNGGVNAIPTPGGTGAWVKEGVNTWTYWDGTFHGKVTLPDGYSPHWEALPQGYLLVPLVKHRGACIFTTEAQLFGCFDEVHTGEPNTSYWWGMRDGQMWTYGRGDS